MTEAAARALIVQLCLRFSTGQLSLIGIDPEDTDLADHGLANLPTPAVHGVVLSGSGSVLRRASGGTWTP